MKDPLRIPVTEMSQAGEARRRAVPLCRHLHFTDGAIGRVSLIVTEMATNLAKYASGGELIIRPLEMDHVMGLEMLSIDTGPGMTHPSRNQRDGFSTAGSSGTGLGAIMRASTEFDIHSMPGRGTVILSRYRPDRMEDHLAAQPVDVGAVCLPMMDEDPCGDGWAAAHSARRSIFMICDGLGHGIAAAEAARKAELLFRKHLMQPAEKLLEILHAGLRDTRGAAVAVAEADHENHAIHYCGIGNISSRIIDGEIEKNMITQNGIAGHQLRKILNFSYPWKDSDLLVMHSDGLQTRWRLADYPGLASRHVSVIAAVLYRDFKRGRDDLTVVVARNRAGRFSGKPQGEVPEAA